VLHVFLFFNQLYKKNILVENIYKNIWNGLMIINAQKDTGLRCNTYLTGYFRIFQDISGYFRIFQDTTRLKK